MNKRMQTGCALVLTSLWLSGCAVPGESSGPAPVAVRAAAPSAEPAAAGAATAAPGAKTYVWSRSMERKRLALVAASRDSGISVLRTQDNQLQVNVPSDFSFDVDSAEIKPDMRPVLDEFAADLEVAELSRLLILVVGHTDDRGSDAANDRLSLARAQNVAKYLESKGIAIARIAVQGRGEHEPMIGNVQPYGRALNRRVEIFLREPAA